MASKNAKTTVEVLLVGADIGGIKLQPHLVKTSRLITVDMICPRSSIAKKTAAKEVSFRKAKADLKGEGWTQRIMFREDVEGHFGLAVQLSEVLDDEWFEKFLRATAKIALKEFRDLAKTYTVGISDIASAPIDALAQLEGTYPGPKTVAQGVLDVTEDMLPESGKSVMVEVPLHRPKIAKMKTVGTVKLEIRA